MEPKDGASALSRRALLKSAALGAASLTSLGLLLPESARAQGLSAFSRSHRGDPVQPGSGGTSRSANSSAGLTASGGKTGGNLAAIQAALYGTGLFIGNEFENWSDATRQSAFNNIAAWGFDFVCPKIGGYNNTWYADHAQLLNWKAMANSVGLQFAPFIYCTPAYAVRDAQICADIAGICGIVVVDMEDEWGAYNAATKTYTYQNSNMTLFGSTYRAICPNTPILVSGYGDPTTRFGSDLGLWPYAEMAAWADGYSPQWYYGYWYGGTTAKVQSTIQWADNECGTAFGGSYPNVPEMNLYSSYTGSGLMPPIDLYTGQTFAQNWQAPIFWWEYGALISPTTPATAKAMVSALVPQDVSSSVAITAGRMWRPPGSNQFLQTITLTNTGKTALSGPLQVGVTNLSSSASIANPTVMHQFVPCVSVSTAGLAVGKSVSLQLRFTAPAAGRFSYDTKVYSGPAAS